MTPPTDIELEMTGTLIRIGCVVFAALFLCVAILTTTIGTPFVDLLFSLFRG